MIVIHSVCVWHLLDFEDRLNNNYSNKAVRLSVSSLKKLLESSVQVQNAL